jgi:transposase
LAAKVRCSPALNALLPDLKKAEETAWLADCYSQILQATTLNLTTAYKNFFDKRAGFPKFKSQHGKQSIQYPQNVKIVDGIDIGLKHFAVVTEEKKFLSMTILSILPSTIKI